MAAVRAHTMQMSTRSNIRVDGQPLAATTSAPKAKGSAKTVCENRINRKKRAAELSEATPGSTRRFCEFTLESKIDIHQISQARSRAGKNRRAMRKKQPLGCASEKFSQGLTHFLAVETILARQKSESVGLKVN